MTTMTYKDQLQIVNQFLGKSDGKDKLCATIQYVCLFVCAGQPGNVKKIQASVAAARKVFRILKPLEVMTPLILKPGFDASTPILMQLLNKVKSLCMAGYLAFDHIAWMGQAGLVSSQAFLERCKTTSLYSWFVGSLCTIWHQYFAVKDLIGQLRAKPEEGELPSRKHALQQQLHKQMTVLIHACLQAVLALGLLEIAPISMRSVGLVGTLTSALNCYMLFPNNSSSKEKKA